MTTVTHTTPAQTLTIMEEFYEVFNKQSYAEKLNSRVVGQVAVAYSGTVEDPRIRSSHIHGMSDYIISLGKESLKTCEIYYCASEMSELIEHAAKVMDPSDKVDSNIFPSKNGFCYFDRGLVFNEYVTIHGLYWYKVEPEGWDKIGLPDTWSVLAFNDTYKEPDVLSDVYSDERMGRWSFSYMTSMKNGNPVITDNTERTSEETSKLIEEGKVVTVSTNLEAFVHSLFLLMQQERVVDRSEKVSSPNRKKVARLKKEGKPSDVVVVRLRKARYVGDGESRESGIEYSIRWFVSGHWRWQPYKNKDGIEDYKRIFISPYIKGPEDKPLKISKKVVAIVK